MASNQNTNQKSTQRTKSMDGICQLLRSSTGVDALAAYKKASTEHTQKSAPREKRGPAPMQLSHLEALPRLNNLGKDGEDHINVGTGAVTDIGKVFSLSDPMPYFDGILNIEVFSIRSYHNFIRSGVRRVSFLRTESRPLPAKMITYPDHYLAMMAHAIHSKVMSHDALKQLLTDVQVPIDCYVTDGTDRRRLIEGNAYALALREIRKCLLNPGMDFQLWKFLDGQEADRIRALPAAERYAAACEVLCNAMRQPINAIKNMIKLEADAAEAKKSARRQRPQRQANEGRRGETATISHVDEAAFVETPKEIPADDNTPAVIVEERTPAAPITTSEELDAAIQTGNAGTVVGWGSKPKPVIAVEAFTPQGEAVVDVSLDLVANVADAASAEVDAEDKEVLDKVLQVAEVSGNDAVPAAQ